MQLTLLLYTQLIFGLFPNQNAAQYMQLICVNIDKMTVFLISFLNAEFTQILPKTRIMFCCILRSKR